MQVDAGGQDLIRKNLKSGGVDLAITASTPRDKRLGFQQIFKQTLVPVLE